MIIGSLFLLLSVLIMALGAGLLGAAYFINKPRTDATKRAQASGSVVEVVARRDAYQPEQVLFHPVVEFTSASGEVIRFESKYGTRPPSQQVGDTLPVYYNPSDPHEAEIQPPALRRTAAVVIRVIGAAVLVLGCLCTLASGLIALGGI